MNADMPAMQNKTYPAKSRLKPALTSLAALAVVAGMASSTLAWIVWQDRVEMTIKSNPLGEARKVVIFNDSIGANPKPTAAIIVFDGQNLRHGLSTAVQARLFAWMRWSPPPMVIAIDSQSTRDIDFRNKASEPAHWRPKLVGRAEDFDWFLLDEIFPLVEKRAGKGARLYLFGHSLAGLYVTDFAIRHQGQQQFRGFAAFSPTFSHDTSLINRLGSLCTGKVAGFMSIGLESAREHILFDAARAALARNPHCNDSGPTMVNHPGMIHAVVMLTGQAHALTSIVAW